MTELTRRVVAGYLADLGGVWLAEDVDMRGPEDGTPAESSRWQAAGWLQRGHLADLDQPSVRVTRLLAESEYGAAAWVVRGRVRGSDAQIAVPMAGFFRVRDGEIVRMHLYGNAVECGRHGSTAAPDRGAVC